MEDSFLPPLYLFPLEWIKCQHLVGLVDASFVFVTVHNHYSFLCVGGGDTVPWMLVTDHDQ